MREIFSPGLVRWKMTWTGLCAAIVFSLSAADSVIAHGTAGSVIQKRTVCAFFSYDDGEPMGYARVTVEAPESELPFQSGATDRNGVVCFAPDRSGPWQVTATDGMGHLQKLVVPVAEESAAVSNAPPSTRPTDRTGRVLAGVGIIFGLIGVISLYHSRCKNKVSP